MSLARRRSNRWGSARGSAKVADINASDASVLATACNGYPTGPTPVAVSSESLNIDKSNFLDNRSGPVETVSSFLNALNLKQYVRAYSYYQDPATYPGPYAPYAAGYADTDVITATFGTVQSEGAAGSLYYKVPLAMHVLTTSSTTQTFVGCYTLRLGAAGGAGHSTLPADGHRCRQVHPGGQQHGCKYPAAHGL